LPRSSTKRRGGELVDELVDELAVERGLGVVVDVGERLRGGEAGEAQSAFEPAPFGRLDLDREQPPGEARV
jgi:hypothetical protein